MNMQNIDKNQPLGDQNNIFLCEHALKSSENYLLGAIEGLKCQLKDRKKPLPKFIDEEQVNAHGLAWLSTYVEALRQLLNWAKGLEQNSNFSELDNLILIISFSEYTSQIMGGIMMSQNEIVRPSDFGLEASDFFDNEVLSLIYIGNSIKSKNMTDVGILVPTNADVVMVRDYVVSKGLNPEWKI